MNAPKVAGSGASGDLEWSEERRTWPHAEASCFVDAGGLRWHVQRMGRGAPILLIHGTGASSHSWRTLAPVLATRYDVIVPDLPGHGFTSTPPRRKLSLPAMVEATAALVSALQVRPVLAVGHSAGAAILIRCCLDGRLAPDALISVNGALLPFRGAAGFLFPPLAKLLFLNPLAPRMVARGAHDHERVVRLIRDTGSELDEVGIELYARLFRSPSQVAATLGMMAHWDLHRLARDLPGLELPLLLLVGENDGAVSPDDAERVAGRVTGARVERLPGLGHLAHEEDPAAVAASIETFARSLERGR
jgi:magnesium chelatase accessory protein